MLKKYAQEADFWSLYILHEEQEELSFRKNIQEPVSISYDKGALITVIKDGGLGYASTPDLSEEGLRQAYNKALHWATRFAHASLLKEIKLPFAAHKAVHVRRPQKPMLKASLEEKFALLKAAHKALNLSPLIVDYSASLISIETHMSYQNSLGADITQEFHSVIPALSASASENNNTQQRTLGGMRAMCQQNGLDYIKNLDLVHCAENCAKDALDLLYAPSCPEGTMDLLIDPDQMMLQIHESIGHPLELDRILGDERNYAGRSFVTLDMFGSYKYGSSLLNVTFDPTIVEQFASYAYDDEGSLAQKEFIIKDGILLRPLGAALGQQRALIPGVANARSSSWNRTPIDRMANLNIEPGSSTFSDMLKSIKRGIYLKSNSSWSIDDSRNKFQFGCEWGQLIEDGRLTTVVKNPNYRGISAQFWRNLTHVGNDSTRQIMGTPYCGKGEPNQCIRVGHASPICLFKDVEVFGGD
jgi:predicted Zn-dependent protease